MGSSSTLDFARLDATGAVIGDIVPLTDSGALQPLAPALEWMGDGYAVTWSEGDSSSGRVMVRRVSAAGELVGPPAEVATVPFSPASPVLAWNGTGLAFTWTARDNASGVDEIKLGRLDATATTIVSEETVNDVTDTDGRGPFATSDVAWTGAGYSVAWPHGDPIGVDQIRSAHVCP